MKTFPVVAQEVKDAALAAYRHFAPQTTDPVLANLLAAGENHRVERKERVRGAENKTLRAVAGFLNSPEGGDLLLGVADNGTIVGLERDYQSLGKKNRDGFSLFLTDLLLDHFGRDLSPLLKLHFHEIDQKEIARLEINPAPRPVFVREDSRERFYLRSLNSTRELAPSELLEFKKGRWS